MQAEETMLEQILGLCESMTVLTRIAMEQVSRLGETGAVEALPCTRFDGSEAEAPASA